VKWALVVLVLVAVVGVGIYIGSVVAGRDNPQSTLVAPTPTTSPSNEQCSVARAVTLAHERARAAWKAAGRAANATTAVGPYRAAFRRLGARLISVLANLQQSVVHVPTLTDPNLSQGRSLMLRSLGRQLNAAEKASVANAGDSLASARTIYAEARALETAAMRRIQRLHCPSPSGGSV
jgi:hypothetical protein